MSAMINDEGMPALMDDLIRDLTDRQLWLYVRVASSALILYDWFLTCHEEMIFVWRRRGNPFVRILFMGARYTAVASAIVVDLSQAYNIISWLEIITIICSELIFVLRTWAIWERSRPILVFFIGLTIVGAASVIVMIQLSRSEALVTSTVIWVIDGFGQYEMQMRSMKFAWMSSTPFIFILVVQFVVLSLTVYKVLRYRRDTLKQSRPTLVDVFWIDGIIYFMFMFLMSLLNVGLTLQVSHPQLQNGFVQLQTVLHSILSTRVVLHTATVLRQEIVDSQATGSLAQNRWSTGMRFAEVTMERVPEGVEL